MFQYHFPDVFKKKDDEEKKNIKIKKNINQCQNNDKIQEKNKKEKVKKKKKLIEKSKMKGKESKNKGNIEKEQESIEQMIIVKEKEEGLMEVDEDKNTFKKNKNKNKKKETKPKVKASPKAKESKKKEKRYRGKKLVKKSKAKPEEEKKQLLENIEINVKRHSKEDIKGYIMKPIHENQPEIIEEHNDIKKKETNSNNESTECCSPINITINSQRINDDEKLALMKILDRLSDEELSEVMMFAYSLCPNLIEEVSSENIVIHIDRMPKDIFNKFSDFIHALIH